MTHASRSLHTFRLQDPINVQPFVKKCFEAVKELVFEANGEISGMVSVEGEKIPFVDCVNPATSGEGQLAAAASGVALTSPYV